MHGFLHGLDISPYGRNALIAALPIEDADAYKARLMHSKLRRRWSL